MGKALQQAFDLLFSGDAELWNIVSGDHAHDADQFISALFLERRLAFLYAGARFPAKGLIELNRTLMACRRVCGLLCYHCFRVGPLRHLQLLFTVNGNDRISGIADTPIVAAIWKPTFRRDREIRKRRGTTAFSRETFL
jgi:ABC-type tungstate transport system substrate-binding protein